VGRHFDIGGFSWSLRDGHGGGRRLLEGGSGEEASDGFFEEVKM
jgi:hypothetical protein